MTTEHSGGGDLSRSLELLWGTAERAPRGPKPALTLDQIVRAAVAVADAEGLAAVSMRRIATELGAGTMSLYRHVPGKAELLDLMIDRVQDVDPEKAPEPETLGARGMLEFVARSLWGLYERHPWLVHVDQARPLLGPGALSSLEYTLRGLRATPLADRELMALLVSLEAFVTGTARNRVNAAMAARRTGMSDEEFWKAQSPILERVMATSAYPALAAADEDAFAASHDEIFELGLGRLLDGVDVLIADRARDGRRRPPTPPGTDDRFPGTTGPG